MDCSLSAVDWQAGTVWMSPFPWIVHSFIPMGVWHLGQYNKIPKRRYRINFMMDQRAAQKTQAGLSSEINLP